jgi:hypothetical protein
VAIFLSCISMPCPPRKICSRYCLSFFQFFMILNYSLPNVDGRTLFFSIVENIRVLPLPIILFSFIGLLTYLQLVANRFHQSFTRLLRCNSLLKLLGKDRHYQKKFFEKFGWVYLVLPNSLTAIATN